MEWLNLVSKKLEKAGEERLSVHSFEIAMDRLEKESFFQVGYFVMVVYTLITFDQAVLFISSVLVYHILKS